MLAALGMLSLLVCDDGKVTLLGVFLESDRLSSQKAYWDEQVPTDKSWWQ